MKMRFIFATVVLAIFSACSNTDEPHPQIQEKRDINLSELRSEAEAIRIAEMAVSGEASITRSPRVAEVWSVKPILGATTRSTSDTLLYAVNFKDNKGFALIAAHRSIDPLLAVTDYGSFNDVANESNENYQYALDRIMAYSTPKPVVPGPSGPLTPIPVQRDTTISETRNHPSVEIALNQKWPEALYCPNYIAGCGPVAAAQILSAFELPTSISYTYAGRDKDNEAIDWSLLKQHSKSDGSKVNAHNGNYNNDQIVNHLNRCDLNLGGHNTIGRFIRQIGELADASYDSSGTGTSFSSLTYAISLLSGKEPVSYTSSPSALFNALIADSKKIALVTGFGYTTNNYDYVGHAWIADGTWQIKMEIVEWVTLAPSEDGLPPKVDKFVQRETSDYFHFNWGWGGNCNGYFLSRIFDPNKSEEYDYTHDEWNDVGVGNLNNNVTCAIYSID